MVSEFGAEANRDGPIDERGTYEFQSQFVTAQLAEFDGHAVAQRRDLLGARRTSSCARLDRRQPLPDAADLPQGPARLQRQRPSRRARSCSRRTPRPGRSGSIRRVHAHAGRVDACTDPHAGSRGTRAVPRCGHRRRPAGVPRAGDPCGTSSAAGGGLRGSRAALGTAAQVSRYDPGPHGNAAALTRLDVRSRDARRLARGAAHAPRRARARRALRRRRRARSASRSSARELRTALGAARRRARARRSTAGGRRRRCSRTPSATPVRGDTGARRPRARAPRPGDPGHRARSSCSAPRTRPGVRDGGVLEHITHTVAGRGAADVDPRVDQPRRLRRCRSATRCCCRRSTRARGRDAARRARRDRDRDADAAAAAPRGRGAGDRAGDRSSSATEAGAERRGRRRGEAGRRACRPTTASSSCSSRAVRRSTGSSSGSATPVASTRARATTSASRSPSELAERWGLDARRASATAAACARAAPGPAGRASRCSSR